MNNNFSCDLQLIEYEQRMVRIGKNDLNNRRLIEYAKAYCNIPPLLEMMRSVTRKHRILVPVYSKVGTHFTPSSALKLRCWSKNLSHVHELKKRKLMIFSSWKAITNTNTYIILILSLFDHKAMPTRDHCDTHCFDNSGCDGWSVTSSAVELGMFEYCRSWWLRE